MPLTNIDSRTQNLEKPLWQKYINGPWSPEDIQTIGEVLGKRDTSGNPWRITCTDLDDGSKFFTAKKSTWTQMPYGANSAKELADKIKKYYSDTET